MSSEVLPLTGHATDFCALSSECINILEFLLIWWMYANQHCLFKLSLKRVVGWPLSGWISVTLTFSVYYWARSLVVTWAVCSFVIRITMTLEVNFVCDCYGCCWKARGHIERSLEDLTYKITDISGVSFDVLRLILKFTGWLLIILKLRIFVQLWCCCYLGSFDSWRKASERPQKGRRRMRVEDVIGS